jgi:hypothetical protein
MFEGILMVLLGILFLFGSFFFTGIRGAFSAGPWLPISRTGRVIIFLVGLLATVEGIRRFLHKPPLEIDLSKWF